MPSIPDALIGVVRTAGGPTGRMWRGLAFRIAERILAILPFFLGFLWLRQGGDVSPATLGLCLAAAAGGQMLFSRLGQTESFLGAYGLTARYRERVIDHLGRLPPARLRGQRAGETAAILTEDVKRVEDVFTHVAPDLVSALAAPLPFLAVLAWVDWRFALALIIPLPPAVLGLGVLRRRFLERGRDKLDLFRDAAGLMVEFVAGLLTLRLYNRTSVWLERLDRHFDAVRRSALRLEAWGGGSIQSYRIAAETGLAMLPLAAAGMAAAGMAAAGGPDPWVWALFVLTAAKLLEPLLDAGMHLTELRSLALSEERIRRLLAEPPLPEGHAVLAEDEDGDVDFEGVGFRYGEDWVLRDVSFHVAAGSMTGVVGPSGAGKSTLLHLLARFADPQAGRVSIAGRDVRDLDADALYGRLGLVLQDVRLFDGTILDNLRIGRPAATEAEILAACGAARCTAFLDRLPEGLATRIGENGCRLSGGERRRLTIARALLKDAPILLLDEATASVDSESQYEIHRALSRLTRGRTVIAVAHRLATIRHADQILVLDGGRIVERGRHDDLAARGGLYAALWREQGGGC